MHTLSFGGVMVTQLQKAQKLMNFSLIPTYLRANEFWTFVTDQPNILTKITAAAILFYI